MGGLQVISMGVVFPLVKVDAEAWCLNFKARRGGVGLWAFLVVGSIGWRVMVFDSERWLLDWWWWLRPRWWFKKIPIVENGDGNVFSGDAL